MKFKEIPTNKIMGLFQNLFSVKEGYSVNSVGYDEDEDWFVVKCFGRDRRTNDVYMFTLFALNPKRNGVSDEEFHLLLGKKKMIFGLAIKCRKTMSSLSTIC